MQLICYIFVLRSLIRFPESQPERINFTRALIRMIAMPRPQHYPSDDHKTVLSVVSINHGKWGPATALRLLSSWRSATSMCDTRPAKIETFLARDHREPRLKTRFYFLEKDDEEGGSFDCNLWRMSATMCFIMGCPRDVRAVNNL